MRPPAADLLYPGPRRMTDTQVLIVGGGPVGLTLVLDLGRHGVRCMLVERNEGRHRRP
jgi:2-polyprenyl-6-methoxyphenol hydroxylase-like FAD-dependent oxidoreductase